MHEVASSSLPVNILVTNSAQQLELSTIQSQMYQNIAARPYVEYTQTRRQNNRQNNSAEANVKQLSSLKSSQGPEIVQ